MSENNPIVLKSSIKHIACETPIQIFNIVVLMWHSHNSTCRTQAQTQQHAHEQQSHMLCCAVLYYMQVDFFLHHQLHFKAFFFATPVPWAPSSSFHGLSNVNSYALSRSITQCICVSKITIIGVCTVTQHIFATAPLVA